MKLHYSPASQYVRKVMVVAIELGLRERIELIADKRDLDKHNPLLKRPVLIADDGQVIIDLPVICEYLNDLAGGRLIPPSGKARWEALSQEALCDGIMEAVTAIRADRTYHPEHSSNDWYERQIEKVKNGLDAFNAVAKSWHNPSELTIARITAGVMCGYFDFAFPEFVWREGVQT